MKEELKKVGLKTRTKNGSIFIELDDKLKAKKRTNSEPTPKKYFGANLQAQDVQYNEQEAFELIWEKIKKVGEEAEAIFLLQFENNLRISEVLNIKLKDLLPRKKILIKILKGGEETVISMGMSAEYLERCRKNRVEPFENLNYQFIYRLYKKLGISKVLKGRSTQAVTHIFRYESTAVAQSSGLSDTAKKNQLHHKGQKTHKYYEK